MDPFLHPLGNLARLEAEFEKYGSLVIGFDFDDTVHDYHKKGSTYPKVINLLRRMKINGFKLICWTAHPDLAYVKTYLEENDIPYDGINTDGIQLGWTSRKPLFSQLLDDRAGLYQCYHELCELMNKIERHEINFKPSKPE